MQANTKRGTASKRKAVMKGELSRKLRRCPRASSNQVVIRSPNKKNLIIEILLI